MNFLRRLQTLDNQLKALIGTALVMVLWLVYAVTAIQPSDAEIPYGSSSGRVDRITLAAIPPSQMRSGSNPIFGQPNAVTTPTPAPTVNSPAPVDPAAIPVPQPGTPNVQPVVPPVRPAVSSYQPREIVALADTTNYGDRFVQDVYGRPAVNQPIIVLHETVSSASSAISFFQTPHPRDDDQASYHALIAQDGTIVYVVPPDKRAFGAGNSVFNGPDGPEAVKTHPKFPPSVNNFAYHISLETPPDGRNNANAHSGYTEAQYRSLSWLVAKSNIPESRITTHKAVDRSSSRKDPRSFDGQLFLRLLRSDRQPPLQLEPRQS